MLSPDGFTSAESIGTYVSPLLPTKSLLWYAAHAMLGPGLEIAPYFIFTINK